MKLDHEIAAGDGILTRKLFAFLIIGVLKIAEVGLLWINDDRNA